MFAYKLRILKKKKIIEPSEYALTIVLHIRLNNNIILLYTIFILMIASKKKKIFFLKYLEYFW